MLARVAPLDRLSPDELLGKRRERGLQVSDANQTLADVAASGDLQPAQLIAELAQPARPAR